MPTGVPNGKSKGCVGIKNSKVGTLEPDIHFLDSLKCDPQFEEVPQ